MSKIKITQERLLAAYINRLLIDKGELATDTKTQAKQREQLKRQINDAMEMAMVQALSDDQLEEFDRRLDDGMTDAEMEEFLEGTGVDFVEATKKALIEFRAKYLNESYEEAEKNILLPISGGEHGKNN